MKRLSRSPIEVIFLIVLAFISSLFFSVQSTSAQNLTQVQGLNRVGPRDPDTGYPLWYEDKNGLRLMLCVDLDNCFIEPPNPLAPLHMPTTPDDPDANFPDEVFYFAAESIFSGVNKGDRAVLVQALEGMFFSDAGVMINDQAVMSRIRIRIDNLQKGKAYTVIYPYGRETFVVEGDAGAGAAKGPGISMTRDIGLVEPLYFEGPLSGDIGPFLVPTNYAGGPFIGDGGLTEVTVTGSPLGTNVFRIEGPGVGLIYPANKCAPDRLVPIGPAEIADPTTGLLDENDCVESFHFSVMGAIAAKFGAKVDRATYTREGNGIFVNVWASTVEGQTLVASVDGGPAMNLSEGSAGNYFGRLSVPPGQIPQTVQVTNTTDTPAASESRSVSDELTIKEATYIVGSGLNVAVQSSNLIDPARIRVYLLVGQADPLVFDLSDQGGGLATGLHVLPAGTSEEQPPMKIRVESSYGGIAESDVTVLGAPTSGGLIKGILAIAGPDRNVIADGKTVVLNGSDSLGPIALSYTWTHDDVSGAISIDNPNSAQIGFATPSNLIPGGKLSVKFTLTVSDGVNSDSDVVTVNMVQPAALPVDTCHVFGATYRDNREKWIVEGDCDLADNQIISVWLGNEASHFDTANMILIGQSRVNEAGFWAVAPGNRSATENGSVPTPAHTRVYVISERGSRVSIPFTIR